jgi:hypothetical protein
VSCGDLDRERQAVEAAAKLAHSRFVAVDLERGVRCAGSGDEQLDRLVGDPERSDGELVLAFQLQYGATRHERDHVWTPLENRSQVRAGSKHLLEVVQDEQELSIRKASSHHLDGAASGRSRQFEAFANRVADQPVVDQRAERDECRSVRE